MPRDLLRRGGAGRCWPVLAGAGHGLRAGRGQAGRRVRAAQLTRLGQPASQPTESHSPPTSPIPANRRQSPTTNRKNIHPTKLLPRRRNEQTHPLHIVNHCPAPLPEAGTGPQAGMQSVDPSMSANALIAGCDIRSINHIVAPPSSRSRRQESRADSHGARKRTFLIHQTRERKGRDHRSQSLTD